MGRGRQKAKQQKIARKLKYLTTDTDYDELAKELGAQEPGSGSFDPFADIEAKYSHDVDAEDETVGDGQTSSDSADDLDEYAKWAAEAAAKATSGEFPGGKGRAEAAQAHPDAGAQRAEAEEAGLTAQIFSTNGPWFQPRAIFYYFDCDCRAIVVLVPPTIAGRAATRPIPMPAAATRSDRRVRRRR